METGSYGGSSRLSVTPSLILRGLAREGQVSKSKSSKLK